MNVSYRQIAKVLLKGMPLQGQDYSDKVESCIKSIEAMPPKQQAALKASYIFSAKVPREERQDLFQDLVAQCLTELAKYDGRIKDLEGFCYTVSRHKWGDWWKQKKRRKRILNGGFVSLNKIVPSIHQDGDGTETELQELIVDDLDLESELNSELDSQAVLETLPDRVKAIVNKRLLDHEKLSSSECNILWRYIKRNGDKIRALIRA